MSETTDIEGPERSLSPSRMLEPLRSFVLNLSPESEAAAVLLVRDWVLSAQSKLRDLKQLLDEQLIAWIESNGDLVIDEQSRLYVGREKVTKCRDVGACLQALFDLAEGEYEKVVQCLSTTAIKHGAARSVLGDEYAKHFTEEVKADIKTGKPKKAVIEANQFSRKGIGTTAKVEHEEIRTDQ